MNYESYRIIASQQQPGVRFRVRRMSFGRRAELARRVRDLMGHAEYFQAGQSDSDKVEASLLSLEVARLYVEWGIQDIDGLSIDGQPATPASLVENGPEPLCREAVQAVKSECGLSEEERKN